MGFEILGLSDELLSAVSDAGYTEPTPIQAQAIPSVFMNRDIMGIAQTGMTALIYQHSGKRLGAAIFVNSALGPGGSMLGAVLGGAAIVAVSGYTGYKTLASVVAIVMVLAAIALYVKARGNGETAAV